MPTISDRTESLFAAAVELPPDRRPAFLDRECTGDQGLRQQLDALLKAHDRANHLLDQPLRKPADLAATSATSSDLVGTIIAGRYKLLEEIGEGGMGTVWVAEQIEPVRRKVALKLIKAGMDSKAVLARFEAERQALAMMDHPNIAKVLDGGVTETGRPFFVMEYVKGVPITEYCDSVKLNISQRLELFVQVCSAVQHAHQKGIIHRDLKPSNILVAPYDDQPVPKVIDFGLAKALHQRLTERTLHTAHETVIGTPLYMSPEQAQLNNLDVDTRSDIYSLGVLLYELLTGTTPLEKGRFKEAAWDEIRRIIREEEPPRPSTRLSSNGTLPSLAACRQTEPVRLTRQVRGELDWIVMKCLEKDRTRRYETANGLARDLSRYLSDEPVEACPPTAAYRLRKFAGKHKTALVAATAFLALLLAAVAVSTWQRNVALQAAASEKRAKEAETKERERAEANEKIARDSEQVAEQQRDTADREKNNALAAREQLFETLYAAEMTNVQTAMENRQYGQAAQLLDQQRPADGKPDFRNFEWHYWRRRLRHGWLRSVDLQSSIGPVQSWMLSFSQGGARLAALVAPRETTSYVGHELLAIFDGATGRELVAPFEPLPDMPDRSFMLLAMSADGTRLAVANAGNPGRRVGQPSRVSILDGGTGREIRRFPIPDLVSEIALTADGTRIAVAHSERGDPLAPRLTASRQMGVDIWDTTTGELVRALPMLQDVGSGQLLWSPDGARLLRQSYSSERVNEQDRYHELFQIVDVASGKVLCKREFPSLEYPLRAWSWSPDGKLLVISEPAAANLAAKPNVQLWDSHTGNTLAILDRDAHSEIIDSNIDFSPDGQLLAVVCGGNEIYVWEVPKLPLAAGASPVRIAAPHLRLQAGKQIMGLAFNSTGHELVSVDGGISIVTWDASAREDRGLGSDSLQGRSWASISPDATKVGFSTYGSWNRLYSVWDLTANRETFRLPIPGSLNSTPVFSPDGRRVVLVRTVRPGDPQENPPFVIHDSQTGEALTTLQLDQPDSSRRLSILSPVFRPDGTQIAALIRIGEFSETRGPVSLVVWDVATAKQVRSIPLEDSRSWLLHYSPDGKNLIVGATDQFAAIVTYDVATGEKRRSIPVPSSVRTTFIDPRHQLYGLNLESDFVLGDLVTGQERFRLPGYYVTEMAINPDGSRLVVGKRPLTNSGESEVSLWSLKSGRRLLAFNRPGNVSAVSFSPDGNRLVAAFYQLTPSAFKPIQIWDATPLPDEP